MMPVLGSTSGSLFRAAAAGAAYAGGTVIAIPDVQPVRRYPHRQ